jgi:hypothetical protein
MQGEGGLAGGAGTSDGGSISCRVSFRSIPVRSRLGSEHCWSVLTSQIRHCLSAHQMPTHALSFLLGGEMPSSLATHRNSLRSGSPLAQTAAFPVPIHLRASQAQTVGPDAGDRVLLRRRLGQRQPGAVRRTLQAPGRAGHGRHDGLFQVTTFTPRWRRYSCHEITVARAGGLTDSLSRDSIPSRLSFARHRS